MVVFICFHFLIHSNLRNAHKLTETLFYFLTAFDSRNNVTSYKHENISQICYQFHCAFDIFGVSLFVICYEFVFAFSLKAMEVFGSLIEK